MSRIATATAIAVIMGTATGVAVAYANNANDSDAGGVAAAVNAGNDEPQTIIMAEGAGHLPDQTAENWVTYADHVVAATVTAEAHGKPDKTTLEKGEGVISRRVTLRVDEVLWSAKQPDKPVPTEFDLPAWGSAFKNGRPDMPKRLAAGDSPRLEPGHSYILALEWEEARCGPGDPMQPAQWNTLGSDSMLPYDDKIIGQGEMAGRAQDAREAKDALRPEAREASLENQMLGRGADDLREALAKAQPGKKKRFFPPAPCT